MSTSELFERVDGRVQRRLRRIRAALGGTGVIVEPYTEVWPEDESGDSEGHVYNVHIDTSHLDRNWDLDDRAPEPLEAQLTRVLRRYATWLLLAAHELESMK